MLLVPCFGNKLKTIFYWDVAPYIWKENETVKGSNVYAINMMETKCKGPKSAYYRVNGGYKGFSEALSSVLDGKKIVETDKGNVDTNYDDAWIPFLNVSWLKEYQHSKNSTLDIHTYFVSKEMVVIVPRYKIEILYKIAVGLKRSFNFLILCLILAILTGIIIWFLVSILLSPYFPLTEVAFY